VDQVRLRSGHGHITARLGNLFILALRAYRGRAGGACAYVCPRQATTAVLDVTNVLKAS
jgi:hypothetical protein